MRAHACTHMHMPAHVHTPVHAHAWICAHTHTYTHTHTLTHMHTHMHACTHTCTHTRMHAHIHTHTCTHTYTHAHRADYEVASSQRGWATFFPSVVNKFCYFFVSFLHEENSVSVYLDENVDSFIWFISAFFIRPFYKMMLKKPIVLHDMESVVSSEL